MLETQRHYPLIALRAFCVGWLILSISSHADAAGFLRDNACADSRDAAGMPEPFMKLDQRIAMRDGVELSLDYFRPLIDQKFPAILQITPYGLDANIRVDICKALAAHYAVIIGYSRGTARSAGEFHPVGNDDGPDGYDIIQWIAAQSWSDQRVVMVGGSYQGINQWQVAATRPKALVAIAPRAIAGADSWLPIMGTGSYHWLVSHNNERADDDVYWAQKNLEALRQGLPLPDRAASYGAEAVEADNVRQWFKVDGYDARRKALWVTPDQFAAMAATGLQVLSITGYFDNCFNTTADYYQRWQAAAPQYHDHHHLIIGPWPHDLSTSRNEGGLRFAAQSKLDLDALTLEWFEHVLRDKPMPALLSTNVTYYQAGLNEHWRHVDTLADMTHETRRYYFAAGAGQAGSWLNAGPLLFARGRLPPVQLTDDPRVIDYLQEGQLRQDYVNPTRWLDAGVLLASGDKLVYATPPTTAAVTISGRPLLTVYASLDVPDIDLYATLLAIEPDGRSVWMANSSMRARYSSSPFEPHLVKPGEVRAYHFSFNHESNGFGGPFQITARRYPAGTRFVLVIRPPVDLQLPRNYHTGAIVGMEDATKAVTAHFKVFQSGAQGSYLELPIGNE